MEEPLILEEDKKFKEGEEQEAKEDGGAEETEGDVSEVGTTRDEEERQLSEDEQRKGQEISAAEAGMYQELQWLEIGASEAPAKTRLEALRKERALCVWKLLEARAQLQRDKRVPLEERMKRAEEKRAEHLRNIVLKAHQEELKRIVNALMGGLEAQSKMQDSAALREEREERLRTIQEERLRFRDKNMEKVLSVKERRTALEAMRQECMENLQEQWRKDDFRLQERKKERQEWASKRARDRAERTAARVAAVRASRDELLQKIQQKQLDVARRRDEHIENIRQKAREVALKRAAYVTLKMRQAINTCMGT